MKRWDQPRVVRQQREQLVQIAFVQNEDSAAEKDTARQLEEQEKILRAMATDHRCGATRTVLMLNFVGEQQTASA